MLQKIDVRVYKKIYKNSLKIVKVNLFQKHLFLHQLTYNMTTDCSLNYKFFTWKFQAQTWGEHVVYRNCFRHSNQFLYTTCSPHILQKEELLTKIYLYILSKVRGRFRKILWHSQNIWTLVWIWKCGPNILHMCQL